MNAARAQNLGVQIGIQFFEVWELSWTLLGRLLALLGPSLDLIRPELNLLGRKFQKLNLLGLNPKALTFKFAQARLSLLMLHLLDPNLLKANLLTVRLN